MQTKPDHTPPVSVGHYLAEAGRTDITVIEKQETASTNTDCRQYLADHNPAAPVLITALTQTGGRGRQGKSFSSPEGGLYMSLLVRPRTPLSTTVHATSAAAAAVCRAVESCGGPRCEIKWVNDIYVNGRKLCGILTEAVKDHAPGVTDGLIIGVGVNLNRYPEDMNATSVLRETGRIPDRNALCAGITLELLRVLDEIGHGTASFMDEYRTRSCVIGKSVRCIRNHAEFFADAVGIDNEGGLLIRFPDGHTETLTSGEITLRVTEN